VEDLLEVAFNAAVADITAALDQIPHVRLLNAGEMALYGTRFRMGWAVPNLCADLALQLRVLLPAAVPYAAPRIAVAPAPPVLSWPHLEEQGLLCLASDAANVSITAPASVVLTLLDEARRLVNASIAGENIQDFEDEFTSYWERWDRIEGSANIFCDPRGPSRWLTAWYGVKGVYVAETETALRSLLGARFGEDALKKVTCYPVPLLWLPRPLRPVEFPATVSDLRAALQEDPLRRRLLDQTLLKLEPQNKLVVIGMQTRRGVAFAGVRVHKVAGLQKGFRQRPPDDIVLGRYDAAKITGARTVRFDPSWVHGRDQNPETSALRAKRVVVIGVGSLGSSVADLLVKAGVGAVTSMDPQALASANSSRHLLGAPAVDVNKAVAVTRNLASRFPHATMTAVARAFADEETIIAALKGADLVISLCGSWSTESLLDALWCDDATLPPVVYGWTEPHAAAGHAVLLRHGAGCLRCLLDDMGKMRLPVVHWPKSTLLQVPACGELFQPYGATELAHIHALVAGLALDALLDRVRGSAHRVWVGRRDLLIRSGGDWTRERIAAHGELGAGGRLLEPSFQLACAACDGK
jgi:hypothetical protein